ncbi:MAG: murein hydrolase activator EnvC family protein [Planctomycetota bacterium]|jgi:septal ring factor EnvC (AmiA/AmiB activator)
MISPHDIAILQHPMSYSFINLLARILVTCILAFSLIASPATASEKDQIEKDLKILQSKIAKLQRTIDVKEDSKSRYTRQLKKIETVVAKVNRKTRDLKKKISASQSELKKLRKTRNNHQRQLSHENDILAKQVYTAFTLGRQEKVKLLFSQKNPAALQRNLVYYQYFSNARAELITKVKSSIDKILAAEAGIKKASLDLQKNHQLLKEQKAQLEKDSAKRRAIISSLDKQLKKQGGNLTRLEDEAIQLQNLIGSIQEILIETPEPKFERKPFSQLRGQLAWPVKGKIKKLFGRQKPLSDLRWQGIMIYAPAGSHVRAVSRGRIAFANWLRGFGNLIIIDHGNSYLSLYGHNESLFKSAREWVESGDIISSIGNSGGQKNPGLYFEIREKGKPQNPTKWCKTSNLFTS